MSRTSRTRSPSSGDSWPGRLTSRWFEARPPLPSWGPPPFWTAAAIVEVALAVAAVLMDLFIPAVVLLILGAFSLALRRQGPASLGVRQPRHVGRMIAQVVLLTLGWNVLTFLIILPVLELATGTQQDVSGFAALQGNGRLLLTMLVLTWTLAAVGEEFAFRGFVQTRMREFLPGRLGFLSAIVLSSVLFGLIHTEQGVVGVLVTTADGVFFSVLRYRFRTLWAAILSHGSSNTVGMIVFFLFGPVQAPW